MDPIDAKPPEGIVTPPVEPIVQPAPEKGTPPPEVKPGVTTDPKPVENPEGDKTVPLAALHEERDKRQSLQAELEALKKVAGNNVLFDIQGNPVQAAPAPTGTPAPDNGQAFKQDLDKAWEDDPRKAVEMTVASALQWRDDVDAAVDTQEMEAETKYVDYGTYRNDVRKYIRTLPMAQRGNPGVADMAYFVVKGQKSGNIYKTAQEEMLEKIRKGEQVTGLNPGTVSTPPPVKGNVASEEQLKVAAMMNLTPEQYMSQIKT